LEGPFSQTSQNNKKMLISVVPPTTEDRAIAREYHRVFLQVAWTITPGHYYNYEEHFHYQSVTTNRQKEVWFNGWLSEMEENDAIDDKPEFFKGFSELLWYRMIALRFDFEGNKFTFEFTE
jgi:hypothetical protein